jgi:hypothetical protein
MAFEHQFEKCPKLCLQDLTVNDIRLFVTDKFDEHTRMPGLYDDEPEMISKLIEEIVQLSSGVFLWVSLVTKSLLNGLTNWDSVSDLEKRLRELPPEF